jgi:NAD(P)H-dependent flavin oxidoreductase YrpB (nitropropane dioxygenase family)
MFGLQTYLALGAVVIVIGGAWALKREIQENATLKQNAKQLEELRIEAEDNTYFQQQQGVLAQMKITSLLEVKKANARELTEWKDAYGKAMEKGENRAWGDLPIPPDVRALLVRNRKDRGPDEVRARDAARDVVRRLREAEGANADEDRRASDGAEGNANRVR